MDFPTAEYAKDCYEYGKLNNAASKLCDMHERSSLDNLLNNIGNIIKKRTFVGSGSFEINLFSSFEDLYITDIIEFNKIQERKANLILEIVRKFGYTCSISSKIKEGESNTFYLNISLNGD